jgi:hypothetical protein
VGRVREGAIRETPGNPRGQGHQETTSLDCEVIRWIKQPKPTNSRLRAVASLQKQDSVQLVPRLKTRKPDTGFRRSPSQLISKRIADLGDWRGELLAQIRELIKKADPDIVEEWKWRGVPVWYHNGIVCTGETYKQVVKMTFAKGAALKDPKSLFNSSLDGNVRRAIDFHEGDKLDKAALKSLIRTAVILNSSSGNKKH